MINWVWAVVYNDDSYYTEDEIGGFNSIDQSKLNKFIIYNKDHPPQHYVLVLKEDMKLIFFRREKQIIDLQNEQQWHEHVCTCFGWKKEINGDTIKALLWLGADGSIVVSDRDIDEI